jgi:hypothetical protein
MVPVYVRKQNKTLPSDHEFHDLPSSGARSWQCIASKSPSDVYVRKHSNLKLKVFEARVTTYHFEDNYPRREPGFR